MTVMGKSKILIVDGDNMSHRALHRFSNFTTKDGYPSGVVFGVPFMVSSLVGKFLPDQIYVVFDGGKAEWRKRLLPDYKDREHRVDVDYEAFLQQKKDVAEALSYLGVRVIMEEGQEADDIIAVLTRRLKGYLTIVSSDKDFNQLIRHNVKIWRPSTNTLLTTQNLFDKVGYHPWECVDWLCLDGDKSDKIPGVKGMGSKRISDFLEKYESITEFLESGVETFGSISRDTIAKVYSTNYRLISLGYAYRKYWRKNITPKFSRRDLDKVAVAKIFRKYEVNLLSKQGFIKSFKNLK